MMENLRFAELKELEGKTVDSVIEYEDGFILGFSGAGTALRVAHWRNHNAMLVFVPTLEPKHSQENDGG